MVAMGVVAVAWGAVVAIGSPVPVAAASVAVIIAIGQGVPCQTRSGDAEHGDTGINHLLWAAIRIVGGGATDTRHSHQPGRDPANEILFHVGSDGDPHPFIQSAQKKISRCEECPSLSEVIAEPLD